MPPSDEQAVENTWEWRVGRSVGRTIYACPPGSSYRNDEVLIGMMDSPDIALEAVQQHNFGVHQADAYDAAREFLDASVAVWREIDAVMTRAPYKGIDVSEEGIELRRREREAWDRYKAVLDAE